MASRNRWTADFQVPLVRAMGARGMVSRSFVANPLPVVAAKTSQQAGGMQNRETSSDLWPEPDGSTLNPASRLGLPQSVRTLGAPAKSFPSHFLRSKGTKKAVLSFAAFFLIAAVFMVFCKRLRSGVGEAGLPHRRLAEGGDEGGEYDEELQALLDGCLDYEEENNLLTAAAVPTESDSLSSAATEASLLVAPHGTASTGVERPSSGLRWPAIIPFSAHETSAAQPVQPFPFSSGQGLGPQLPIAKDGTSADAILADSGWGPKYPQLEPDAWLEQLPDIISSDEAESSAGPGAQGSPEDEAQPPTSAAAKAKLPLERAESGLLDDHPYVRVPKVQPNALRRTLKAYGFVASSSLRGNAQYDILKAMRELFAKSELDAKGAEELMKALEKLLNYVRVKISPYALGRSFAAIADRLGMYFLAVDSVFRAQEALGPAARAAQWWQQFINQFKIEFPEYPLDRMRPKKWPQQRFNQELAWRLQQALRTYKKGICPDKEEIITLKRMLFFSGYTRFAEVRWDPWRSDDEVYRAEHDSSAQSEKEDGDDDDA
ncbi:hypothetical protein Emag_007269 [Eimeria magna]